MELSIPGKRGLSSSSTEATPAKQIRETSSDAAKHLLKSSINVEPTHRLTSLKTSILPPVTSKFSTLTLTTNRHKSLLVTVQLDQNVLEENFLARYPYCIKDLFLKCLSEEVMTSQKASLSLNMFLPKWVNLVMKKHWSMTLLLFCLSTWKLR